MKPAEIDGSRSTRGSSAADRPRAAVPTAPSPAVSSASGWLERARRWVPPLVGLVVFLAALLVLRRELHAASYPTLVASVFALPGRALALAVLLTAANYLVLTGYDLLAVRYAGKTLSSRRIMLASLVAYGVANNVGFGAVSGASVRYRFYSRWGVSAAELSRIVLFYVSTFWLGILLLGGLSLSLDPLPEIHGLPGGLWTRALGVALMLVCLGYAGAALAQGAPLRFGRFEVALPSPRLVAAQLALSSLDWILAAAVLFVLLPEGRPGFGVFLGAFLAAQVLALISHVPGGVGVFETLMLLLLKPALAAGALLPSLMLFRVVYYLLPLAFALTVLLADELRLQRARTKRVRALFGALEQELTPRVLAVVIFLSGAVLLFSGATPAADGRLAVLGRFMPLPVIEVSHFMGSVLGTALLLLSRGISRRLDLAYHLTWIGSLAGIAASLLKGADYEEAIVLLLVLLALARSRRHFDRRTAFFAGRLSPGWVAAVLAVVGASVWLGFFSYRHVDYSTELWWQFGLGSQASRFLRASVGSAMALLVVGISRLLRPAPPVCVRPSEEDLAAALRVIQTQTSTVPFLCLVGDKTLLFDAERKGFLMYGVRGRTWVAMGDPVGPEPGASALVRGLLELCDDYDGIPVFYQVASQSLHLYADYGLTFVKLGEEARVSLDRFDLEGGESKGLRRSLARLDKEGGRFRVVPPEEVEIHMEELASISDEWLRQRGAAEKGFSLGFFEPSYVSRLPAAIVERAGRIEAFVTLWPGPGKHELSVDLMRFRDSAPRGVMESLLVHVMRWGQDQGYRWFTLGMAPLAGLGASPLTTLWSRIGSFVYEHGEPFYNFQGVRAYKGKFHPQWEPRYLAYPGGLGLPRILADVAALIAGGYGRIFSK